MTTQQKNSVRAKKGFSTENVETVIREYKKTRWAPNSHRIGKPDSLSAWYSIEEMENFIALAKSNGGDGIRFYYGAFPENYDSTPEYAGRQTLVKVATRSRTTACGDIANKDLFITQNGQAKIISGIIPSICPPKCSASEGGMGDLGITLVDKGDRGMEII